MFPPDTLRAVIRSTRAGRPAGEGTSPQDAEHILEIVCLATAADGTFTDDELEALRVIGGELRAAGGTSVLGERDVDALLNKVTALGARDERVARLRVLAGKLTGPVARAVAFKSSVAIALADLADSDEEFEFEIDLLDALGLSNEDGEKLSGEVHALTMVSDES